MSFDMTLEELENIFDPELFEDWMREFFEDGLSSAFADVQKVHFTETLLLRMLQNKCNAEIGELDGAIEKAQEETQSRSRHRDSEYPATRQWYTDAQQKEQDLRKRRALLESAVEFFEMALHYHNDRWFGSSLFESV